MVGVKKSIGMKFYPPEDIWVKSPRPSTTPRGIYATKSPDPKRTIHISELFWNATKEAADILGMTTSEFIRWSMYATANEILRLARENNISIDHSPTTVMIGNKRKPRYDKVLIVEREGAELSLGLTQSTKLIKEPAVKTKKARPLEDLFKDKNKHKLLTQINMLRSLEDRLRSIILMEINEYG